MTRLTCRLIRGDSLAVLRGMPDASVNCCVTSPPYWGLRDYGHPSQMGLEATPDEYVAKLVAVFREVRRVLRDDGTLWLNLGDSYAAARGGTHQPAETLAGGVGGYSTSGEKVNRSRHDGYNPSRNAHAIGLKHKDLVGIPWMVAFALRADGWYLRQEIIWHKPAPMPESVTDRCTKAHEQVFLFAKGQRVTRVVQCSDLNDERFHFGQNILAKKTASRHPVTKFCVALASAIFDNSQEKHNFSLPPFYSEVWEKRANSDDGGLVPCHPAESRLTGIAALFLSAKTTAEQFTHQLNSLWLDLRDGNHLLEGWVKPLSLPPSVHGNADGTIAVYHAGEVCEFKCVHAQIVHTRTTTCKYFCDMEAIKEDSAYAGSPSERVSAGVAISESQGDRTRTRPVGRVCSYPERRNKRSVWTVNTKPYAGAHFAVMPEALVEPCVLAGTSERGCCPKCGAPWVREVEHVAGDSESADRPKKTSGMASSSSTLSLSGNGSKEWAERGGKNRTVCWRPFCECPERFHPVPCTVLDPFAGSGTVCAVSIRLGRNAVGIDLNPDYLELARRRCKKAADADALFTQTDITTEQEDNT